MKKFQVLITQRIPVTLIAESEEDARNAIESQFDEDDDSEFTYTIVEAPLNQEDIDAAAEYELTPNLKGMA